MFLNEQISFLLNIKLNIVETAKNEYHILAHFDCCWVHIVVLYDQRNLRYITNRRAQILTALREKLKPCRVSISETVILLLRFRMLVTAEPLLQHEDITNLNLPVCSTSVNLCVQFNFLALEGFFFLVPSLLTRISRSVPLGRLSTSVPSCHMAGMLYATKPVVPVAKTRVHLDLRFAWVRSEVRLRSCSKLSLCCR